MMESRSHACSYRTALVWEEWRREGDQERRRSRYVPACTECGRERPARRLRVPVLEEVRASNPHRPSLIGPVSRRIASILAASGEGGAKSDQAGTVGAKGVFGRAGAAGIPSSAAESCLEEFLGCGWLSLQWRIRGSRRDLHRIQILDRNAILEVSQPGLAESRAAAKIQALEVLRNEEHPITVEAKRLLQTMESLSPELIRGIAAIGVHVSSGEILSKRVFSVRYLGDSKALARIKARLERLFGPLGELGIREGGATTLVGGKGVLCTPTTDLNLVDWSPFLGLSRETLSSLAEVRFPAGGLFVVENFAAFEACCRGDVQDVGDVLIVWSNGYPGRGVRALVEAANRAGAGVRVWADLDLAGIRIARLIAAWTRGSFSAYRMAPADVAAARVRRPMSSNAVSAMRRDMALHPEAPLTPTLATLLAAGHVVEQECFLSR